MLRRPLLASAAVVSVLGLTSVALQADAATTFTQVSLTTTVTGTSVRADTTIRASTATTLKQYGICARDAANANVDFPAKRLNVTISTAGTAYSATKTFAPGTYTYYPCGLTSAGRWVSVGRKTFTVTTAATPTSTDPVAPDAWRTTYREDFNQPAPLGQVGSVYGSGMRGYDGCCDSTKKGVYAPDRVLSVADGVLSYNLHSENGQPLVAAPQPVGWTGQTYGRFTVRWRTNTAPHYAVAFLLWPVSESWDDGEIDWPEVHGLGGRPRPASATPGTARGTCYCPTWSPWPLEPTQTTTLDWHTDVTEWVPGAVRWYRDGELVGQTTTAVPTKPFRWSLQAETNPELTTVPADEVGTVQIDSLRVESYT
jgi:beta-glucanase (GH16 family)